MSGATTRASRAAATRAHLVAVGRRLFAERGYAATATEDLVAEAGLTRGALYHHFGGKQDLFRAVFAEVVDEVQLRVEAAAMAGPEPWDGLLAGCAAYVEAGVDPAVRRIALIDGPSVLGWEAWRDTGARPLFGVLATGLHWVMAAGQIEDSAVAPLAHVLLGALNEGTLYVAGAADRDTARDEVVAAIGRLLAGLRPTP